MLLQLSKTNFNFLKNYIPYAYAMVDNVQMLSEAVSFNVDDIGDFQDEITMEIVDSGMDDEDTVNKNGIKMYGIYDLILSQKYNSV